MVTNVNQNYTFSTHRKRVGMATILPIIFSCEETGLKIIGLVSYRPGPCGRSARGSPPRRPARRAPSTWPTAGTASTASRPASPPTPPPSPAVGTAAAPPAASRTGCRKKCRISSPRQICETYHCLHLHQFCVSRLHSRGSSHDSLLHFDDYGFFLVLFIGVGIACQREACDE